VAKPGSSLRITSVRKWQHIRFNLLEFGFFKNSEEEKTMLLKSLTKNSQEINGEK